MNSEAAKTLTGMQQYPGFIKPFQEKLEESSEARGEMAGLEKGMETERLATREKARASAEQTYADKFAKAPQREQLEAVSEKMEAPFVPTKETAGDMAQLFALVNIAGFALGAGGKRNSQAALSGMNGMLEGYQKGRQDLYKKEKDAFDTNIKQLKMRYDTLDRQLKEALETYKTDKQAGLQKADMAYAQAGADFYKKYADKFGLAAMYEYHKQAYDGANRMFDKKVQEEDRARTQAFRERQAVESAGLRRQGLDIQRQMLQLRMDQASKSAEGKNLKPPPKEIVAQNQLRNNIIPKLEESLPVLKRLNEENSWNTMTALLAIDPRAAELKFKDDPEALNLILTLAYFRSKEFETAGKALTKKEDQILAPIVRGDLRVYEGIKNAMEQGLKSLKQEQKGLEGTYPFIKEFNRAMRGETEDSGASSSTPSKYSIGQIIKRGNKSYRVTGLSDPNNPDVEEVK
jgi:hypothetical protein